LPNFVQKYQASFCFNEKKTSLLNIYNFLMHLNYEGKKTSLIFLDNFKQKRPLCLMQPQPKLVAFAAIPAFFCKRKWIDGTRDKESIKEKVAKYKVTTIFFLFRLQ